MTSHTRTHARNRLRNRNFPLFDFANFCYRNCLLSEKHTGQSISKRDYYQLLTKHYDEFEQVYADRFQDRYGFWRPVIRKSVHGYLRYGNLREGFARVRRPDCGHEMFVSALT